MTEWFTIAEIAALGLPGLPESVRGITLKARRDVWKNRQTVNGNPMARRRKGRGGGFEYHRNLLPTEAQVALVAREQSQSQDTPPAETGSGASWAWFEALPDRTKQKAADRLSMLESVETLIRGGLQKNTAVATVANVNGVGARSVFNWYKMVEAVDRADWLPALAPRNAGRTTTVECDPRAWEFLKADYLRLSQPTFKSCYQRLKVTADAKGWTIPSARTLERRIEREIPRPVRVLLREGEEKLKRLYPPQIRDRSMFHALEAVNIDGHKWDVFVQWEDGSISRPIMTAIQDLYSGKLLAWRIDKSENADSVRLAFRDLFERYGIPNDCYMDNGRAFAAKQISGGATTRYRFKVKAEEPTGVLIALGVQLHWTNPYSGQSKPIERAFRDLCDTVAKHPAFEGAYTGNAPNAKPENYGDRAVELETFLKVVDQGIRMHNALEGRRAANCRGRSFDTTFSQSYQASTIKRAGPEQLRRLMLAVENIKADKRGGWITLLGNRYWDEKLISHAGQSLTVRFDPDNLHKGVYVYRLDGSEIGFAECKEAVGFADTNAAREQSRNRRNFKKATREAARLHKTLSAADVVAQMPEFPTEFDDERPQAVRLVANGSSMTGSTPEPSEFDDDNPHRLAPIRLVHGMSRPNPGE